MNQKHYRNNVGVNTSYLLIVVGLRWKVHGACNYDDQIPSPPPSEVVLIT